MAVLIHIAVFLAVLGISSALPPATELTIIGESRFLDYLMDVYEELYRREFSELEEPFVARLDNHLISEMQNVARMFNDLGLRRRTRRFVMAALLIHEAMKARERLRKARRALEQAWEEERVRQEKAREESTTPGTIEHKPVQFLIYLMDIYGELHRREFSEWETPLATQLGQHLISEMQTITNIYVDIANSTAVMTGGTSDDEPSLRNDDVTSTTITAVEGERGSVDEQKLD
jgi:hypothetical protein